MESHIFFRELVKSLDLANQASRWRWCISIVHE